MPSANVETDPLFKLLTDALRAGPGSPEWHQAVSQLGNGQSGAADEYRLILDARQHLQSGKNYRSIRAGAGFTRRLMQGIDDEATGGRGRGGRIPVATLITGISAVVIVLVLGVVGYSLFRGAGGRPANDARVIHELKATPLLRTTAAAAFTGAPAPEGWRRFGSMPLAADGALRPDGAAVAESTRSADGGIVTDEPLPAGRPFEVEAEVTVPKTASDLAAQVFVTDRADFDPPRGTAGTEVAWLLQGDSQAAQVAGESRGRGSAEQDGDSLTVRIRVGPRHAIVTGGRRQLWVGEHGLDPDKPRYVGIRFLRGPGTIEAGEVPSVESIRVRTRAGTAAADAAAAAGQAR